MEICHMALPATEVPAIAHPMMRQIVAPKVNDDPATATKVCRTLSESMLT